MIGPGTRAPPFCLRNQENREVRLEEHRGKWVVLYFYPMDGTPGCTVEAREFSALKPEFDAEGAVILGVSRDSAESHGKFAAEEKITFNILSAAGTDTLSDYDARGLLLPSRDTHLIDPEGNVAHAWKSVTVKGHAAEVLAKLRELKGKR